jgi:hypothetical protein
LTFLALPLLSLSTVASTIPLATDLFSSAREAREKLDNFRTGVIDEFFPETNTSIMDLDQAVALLAGMTVLGFYLYSTAEERYRRWWEAQKERISADAHRMVDNSSPEYERALDALAGPDPEVVELHELRQNGGRR